MSSSTINFAIKTYCFGLVLLSLLFFDSESIIISSLSFIVLYIFITYLLLKIITITYKSIIKTFKTTLLNAIYYFLFKILQDSKYCYIFLNNNLDIIFTNKTGHEKFKLHNKHIQESIPNFHYYFLLNKQFKFKSLNPKLYQLGNNKNFIKSPMYDSLLTSKLNGTYANSYKYGDYIFSFVARPFRLFNKPIGLIVEFDFIPNNADSKDSINHMKLGLNKPSIVDLNNIDFIDLINQQ